HLGQLRRELVRQSSDDLTGRGADQERFAAFKPGHQPFENAAEDHGHFVAGERPLTAERAVRIPLDQTGQAKRLHRFVGPVVVGNIRERLHLAEGRDREGPDHKGSQGQSQTFLAHFVSPYQWSWIFRYFCRRLVRAVTERISVFRTVSVPVSSPGRGIPSVDLHERLPPKRLAADGSSDLTGHLLSCGPSSWVRPGGGKRQRNPESLVSRRICELLPKLSIFAVGYEAWRTRFETRCAVGETSSRQDAGAGAGACRGRRGPLTPAALPPGECAAASRC